MKTYKVTLYIRSNACISPNKAVFQHIVKGKSAKQVKQYAWYYFNAWYNTIGYSRHDVRIEAAPLEAE